MQVYELYRDGERVGEAVEFSSGDVRRQEGGAGIDADGSIEGAMDLTPGIVWRLVWTNDVAPPIFQTSYVPPEAMKKLKGYLDEMKKDAKYSRFLVLDGVEGDDGPEEDR